MRKGDWEGTGLLLVIDDFMKFNASGRGKCKM